MALLTYALCVLTSLVCAVLLLRAFRRTGTRLLLWSALCFGALTVSNFVLVLDRFVYPDIHLTPLRLGAALAGILLLLFGLVWESD
jgi:hypothetical protein